MKLGKQPARIDKRTIKLTSIFKAVLPPLPDSYSVDKALPHLAFPNGEDFGNNDHGDCVMVDQYMWMLRAEGIEQGKVLPVTEEDVLQQYFYQTGGEENDYGLIMLDSFKIWRKEVIRVGPRKKFLCFSWNGQCYKIHAFASIDIHHFDEVKAAIALLYGMPTGLLLPATAAEQWNTGRVWDVTGEGAGTEPGSWGGHAVYTMSYEAINAKTDDYIFMCYTWGRWQPMTYRFLLKYCDERYAVVDKKNRPDSPVDEEKLTGYLIEVSK